MATRKVYRANTKGNYFVNPVNVDFEWNPGFAVVQKQKNIENLHKEYKKIYPEDNVLEISTKSKNELGVKLSAFNLSFRTKSQKVYTVEAAFQSSKKFENGGPYRDILDMDPKSAKRDERLKTSGKLVSFVFPNYEWPLEPKTLFYDWLYINSLCQNRDLAKEILNYNAFTDIEFNPNKSINCQARSAALYVSLAKRGLLKTVLKNRDEYIKIMKSAY
ncbi:DarT1-associated NADAR antitoxin family protein [Intestinibacter sp.]|uniref:DarT1-associated NADAR antitoxin family protein n=1 Tax=Intestinibacter sp. TaxID=1965304 RepID=UPI003F15BFFB